MITIPCSYCSKPASHVRYSVYGLSRYCYEHARTLMGAENPHLETVESFISRMVELKLAGKIPSAGWTAEQRRLMTEYSEFVSACYAR